MGGLLLGVIESLAVTFIDPAFKDVVAFAVLILVLMFRPEGLFGEALRRLEEGMRADSAAARTGTGACWRCGALRCRWWRPTTTLMGVIARICLYSLLALGLNIVVGFAGLLDIGYVAFFGIGSYVYAFLASPHFGLHLPFVPALPGREPVTRGLGPPDRRADPPTARRLSGHRHAGFRRDRLRSA